MCLFSLFATRREIRLKTEMSQVSSAADLTASLRRTTGTRPPPLVGCSVTVLGDSVYVFGGRLVPTRTMVRTLYKLDLSSLEWSLLSGSTTPTTTSTPTTEAGLEGGGEGGGGEEGSQRDGHEGEGSEKSSNQPNGALRTVVEPPRARYFHSCCAWGTNKLVIFGGEGYHEPPIAPSAAAAAASTPTTAATSAEGLSSAQGAQETSSSSPNPKEGSEPAPALQTLDDLHVFNIDTCEWEQIGEVKLGPGVVEKPKPRYAHLGVVCTAWDELDGDGDSIPEEGTDEPMRTERRKRFEEGKSCLMIMGGQDIRNTYLHTTDILNLDSMTWIQTGKWDRHIGTYRAIATTANCTVKPGTLLSPGGTKGGSLESLSWTERNSLSRPEPLMLFSNFNFTQVRRDLDLLSSPLSSNSSNRLSPLSLSNHMVGSSLPPGLRFPSGFQLGHHLIIFGTFLSQHINNFSIWALDLGNRGAVGLAEQSKANGLEGLEWTRVDPGSVLQRGSWNRAVGWKNNVVVLGDRERDIAADYDHRQTNFTHVAFVDLEAHGIYQPPPRPLPPIAQQFGLTTLAQPFLSDFEIVCSDGKRLACSRKILDDRWSWFHSRILEFRVRASGVVAAQHKRAQDASLENSEAGSFTSAAPAFDRNDGGTASTATSEVAKSTSHAPSTHNTIPTMTDSSESEARLTPRTLELPEPSSVVFAFLQYLYTLTLCTRLQLELPILSALLTFSNEYQDPNLKALVVHALHETLSNDSNSAPAVYEAATLGGCTALQIRALKSLMSSPRAAQVVGSRSGGQGGGQSRHTGGSHQRIQVQN